MSNADKTAIITHIHAGAIKNKMQSLHYQEQDVHLASFFMIAELQGVIPSCFYITATHTSNQSRPLFSFKKFQKCTPTEAVEDETVIFLDKHNCSENFTIKQFCDRIEQCDHYPPTSSQEINNKDTLSVILAVLTDLKGHGHIRDDAGQIFNTKLNEHCELHKEFHEYVTKPGK